MSTTFLRYLSDLGQSPFLLDGLTKATLLLLAATVATALLKRSSAAVRHRIWCLTFAALVLLPGLSAALPEWRLAVLPDPGPAAYRSLAPREESSSRLAPPAEPTFANQPTLPTENDLVRDGSPLAEREGYYTPASDRLEQSTPAVTPARLQTSVATFWFIGAILALLPLGVGLARTFTLRRRSLPIDDARWMTLVDELRQRLTLSRRVRLYENATSLMPMTWGILRPVVMLPRQAHDWTDGLRRIVLLHELAHIKRCDVGFQLLGRVACALYWFHPLAWYALRRMRIERELACDDCVVLAGERATDYATELVQIARAYRTVPFAAAIAMAQRSNLEHRLRAMFDRACSHLPVSTRMARALFAVVLVLATTVAAVRLAPQTSAASDGNDEAGEPKETTPNSETAKARIAARVVDSEGKPIPGARVRVFRVDTAEMVWTEAGYVVGERRTDTRGEATIEYANTPPFATWEHFVSSGVVVLADADGRTFDFDRSVDATDPVVLRLPDDAPIEGRVLDLEGRPRSGVRVSVVQVDSGADDLDAWIAAAKQNPAILDERSLAMPVRSREVQGSPTVARYPGKKNLQLGAPEVLPTAVTDDSGRFRLAGLGKDRLVMLELAGGGMAKTWLNVVTRDMPAVPYPVGDPRHRVPRCFGRRFDLTAEPEQPISGMVKDADTGRPLAGIEVRLYQYADSLLMVDGFLSTVTDRQGRYTLFGVPKPHDPQRAHRLRFVPGIDQPYFRTNFDVPKQQGLDPVTCDAALRRGIWIRGRVTDAVTGKPIQGVVEYYPFLSNKAAGDYVNFDPRVHGMEGDRYATDDDGDYRLPGLPGRGVVAFIAKDGDRYPEKEGANAISGLHQEGTERLNVYYLFTADLVNALREVNPPQDAAEATCDILLPALDVAQVDLVDPEGRPLTGVVTRRLAPRRHRAYYNGWSFQGLSTSMAEIVGSADQSRTVMFLHRDRKLGAALSLPAAGSVPKQLVLQPCATVAGRIVDRQRKPLAGLNFELTVPANQAERASGEFEHQLTRLPTDEEGRFKVELVPPGVSYVVWASLGGQKLEKTTPVIQPGQSLDLGDLVLATTDEAASQGNKASKNKNAAKPVTDSTTMPADKPNDLTLRGRVLLPDGKPAAGVDLFWPHADSPPPRTTQEIRYVKRGASDDGGRFQIVLSAVDVPASGLDLYLVAHKAGYGIDWLKVEAGEAPAEITLRLVEDRPIRGRMTDTEGRPVAGARLAVNSMLASRDGHLDAFLTAWERDWRDAWQKLDHGLHSPLDAILGTETDRDGRFELSGIGLERVAGVAVLPPGYAADQLRVVNRQGFDASKYNDITWAALTPFERQEGLYVRLVGPQLDYVAEAELVIRGKVFTGNDRTPVAGAVLYPAGRGEFRVLPVRSDEQGRYELHGLARNRKVFLMVTPPPDSDVLPRTIELAAAPGQAAIESDVELKRGVVIEGRVFDQATGRGLKGGVRFVPLPGNKFADQPGFSVSEDTANDGRFRLALIPGPGVLMAHVSGDGPSVGNHKLNRYRQATFSEEDRQRVLPTDDGDDRNFTRANGSVESLSRANAAKVIDRPEGGPPVTCDLPVDAGKTVNLSIEDEEHQPVPNAFIAGLADSGPATFRIAEAACTIYALGADRPRKVCILHPERRLAASLTLTGDELGPVTVRLAPAASIAGRALDATGEPIADAVVQVNYARRNARELDRFVSLEHPAVKTDDEGRFQITNIVPGERFVLDFRQEMAYFRANLTDDQRQLKAGEKLDLGDAKMKQLRIGG